MDYLSLILFTLATCGTPGPNNTLVMASGASYGFRRSLPAVIGINTGFPVMVMVIGLGLGGFLQRWPVVLDVLRPIGVGYLFYLAYRIATAPVGRERVSAGAPLSFLRSALFQFVNPKAWVMVVGAIITFSSRNEPLLLQILLIAVIFVVFGAPCTTAWCLAGAGLHRAIRRPIQLRLVNVVLAGLLVLSVIPILGEIRHSLGAEQSVVTVTRALV
jgi:threonine/homoserine/homoserine lactone efflux protein